MAITLVFWLSITIVMAMAMAVAVVLLFRGYNCTKDIFVSTVIMSMSTSTNGLKFIMYGLVRLLFLKIDNEFMMLISRFLKLLNSYKYVHQIKFIV